MFADSIETVGGFTRAIQFISRNYKSTEVIPGTATMFFVNDEGDAVTCRHVAQQIAHAAAINQNYQTFKEAKSQLTATKNRKGQVHTLEQKYNLQPNSTVQLKTRFVDCADRFKEITIHIHEHYDIAILRFREAENLRYVGHASFAGPASPARPGDFLCRLGFPFPEFSDFTYDATTDEIGWLSGQSTKIPRFPIEGMLTRFLGDETGVFGIEMSTPGLRGQSGGPLFDARGMVYGMQFATHHLHLGFDMVDYHMNVNGQEKTLNNQPFLHVGQCISSETITAFLREKDIPFDEA